LGDTTTNTSDQAAGRAEQLVAAAISYETELRNSKYQIGGKSKTALDCSYFVYLVYNKVFPEYKYLDSAGIITSAQFEKVTSAAPGDVIYWEPSHDRWWDHANPSVADKVFPAHVGIVLNQQEWVGRQTSSVGRVKFSDKYFWGTRTAPAFHRYKGVKTADTGYLSFKAGQ
jgi:cell wall-associated NlpC family hydrolase